MAFPVAAVRVEGILIFGTGKAQKWMEQPVLLN
jgi:hypothetical protein